jgi:hypothetical protein
MAKRAIDRDRDFRTLKMCVKYLEKVCTPRMRRPTIEFLVDKFIVNAGR